MPVPKKKHSRSRQGKRRANWRTHAPNLSACPACHAPTLSHHACLSCGSYQGRTVIAIKEKSKKGKEEKTASKPSKEK